MFNVSCKDPLDAETVGERRERKLRETQIGVDSVNDALANVSLSRVTPLSPSSASSQPASGRSSRTSIITPSPEALDRPKKPRTSVRDYFSFKTSPASARPVSKHQNRRRPETRPPTTPVPTQPPRSLSYVQPTEWHFVDPAAIASPGSYLMPSHASIDSDMPRPDPQAAQGKRCRRLLRKIELANDKAVAARLAEVWPPEHADEEEMMHEFRFETALYALACCHRLAARQFPSQADGVFLVVGGLSAEDRGVLECGNILHLGASRGSPESWYLGTKLPEATIHSVGPKDLDFDITTSSWGLPPNVVLEHWGQFPRLDYVDGIFDAVVVAHDLFASVKCTLWPELFEHISRVLTPDGLLMVSAMDALPQRAGDLLDRWVHDHVYLNLLRRFMVHRPCLLLPSWLDEADRFAELHIHRIPFPCMPLLQQPRDPSGGFVFDTGDGDGDRKSANGRRKPYSSVLPLERLDQVHESGLDADACAPTGTPEQLAAASLAGWNCYERLYAGFLPSSSSDLHALHTPPPLPRALDCDWWLDAENVRNECQQTQPYFEMTTFVYRNVLQE